MNILITGAWQQAKERIKEIKNLGHQVVFQQYEKDLLPCSYDWVEGIICNGIFLSHPIEKFTNLKYIQLTSAGVDRIPMEYVKKQDIKVKNARGVYSIPMAEYTISGVLDLYKQKRFFYEKQKEHQWEKKRNLKELRGQTVCILGCGSVGTECAKRFNAFECEIIGVDIYVKDYPYFSKIFHLNDIQSALKEADIVVLTLPLTEQTRHMFNKKLFSYMKEETVIVNIARGALIDTEALIDALKYKLYGAVLDVFEEEPLDVASKIWDMENVIITPHNSFVGDNNGKRLSDLIIKNLENV